LGKIYFFKNTSDWLLGRTSENIPKWVHVLDLERVYQEIKQHNEVIKPSPFKQTAKGLFRSLSLTNATVDRPKPFMKRLSESQDSPRKRKVPFLVGKFNDSPTKGMKMHKLESSDNTIASKSSESTFFVTKDKENSLDIHADSQDQVSTSSTSLARVGVDLPAHYTGFSKVAKQNEIVVTIEEEENGSKSDRTIIRKMIGDFHKRTLPTSRNWASSPKLSKSTNTTLSRSPLHSEPPSLERSEPSLAIPYPAKSPTFSRAKTDTFLLPPGRFRNNKELKRQNSLTLGELPKNYREFLTMEEVANFSRLIEEIDDAFEPSTEAVATSCDLTRSEKGETALQLREDIAGPNEFASRDVETETVETTTEGETITKSRRKSSKSKDSVDRNSNQPESSRKKARPKVTNDSGWNSNAGNQNYRAMNLKPKKGHGRKLIGKGNQRFRKLKSLESYNYRNSDEQYLLAGYQDLVEGAVEEAHEKLEDKVVTLDFLGDQEGAIRIDGIYGNQPCYIHMGKALNQLTGYTQFRNGQEQVVRRILEGKSTLLILPTGGGKSLCYQLPVFILRHVPKARHLMAIVVTPTLSLMFDQLRCLFPGVRGACLSSTDTTAKAASTISKIKKGMIDVLFVSPERLRSNAFMELVRSDEFPTTSFACIDEVHCISEWSHNFRTSYLHLKASLLESLKVKCVLGLTGTATIASRDTICSMLDIDPENGVVSFGSLRSNIAITVSHVTNDEFREGVLLDLLKSDPYKKHQSIIIYVMFQYQADKVAQFLRIRQLEAESYHAGKSLDDRQRIQSNFLCGTLRILVATVAFGMGINKRDVAAVIHFCMPKSIENYVQEIGRAGRDGRLAHCHLFLAREDYIKHRSLVFSDHANEDDIGHFLAHICSSKQTFISLDVVNAERLFDMKESVISTILSYLEIRYPEIIQQYGPSSGLYTVFFAGKTTIESILDDAPFFSQLSRIGKVSKNSVSFNIGDAVNETKMDYQELVKELWELHARKLIRIKHENKHFLLRIKSDEINDSFLTNLKCELYRHLDHLEKLSVLKLDEVRNV
jgi:RecQ family ATP-dependent DNA helicase